MQAVVLAGGFGKRLAPLTSEVPKPLLPVGGKPILVRQIEWLRGFGVR
ncbi:MAG: NTP transferase domain-containing protein, partial [Pyrobaculum sp.]|nr:NTP transferase domain-containing protein [Pyrobaculum sp.]